MKKWTVKIIFMAGFFICCYPLLSSIVTGRQQANIVSTFEKAVEKQDDAVLQNEINKAEEYNDILFQSQESIVDHPDEKLLSQKSYQNILNVMGNEIMGSIEIPKIKVNLPIYHGTGEEALSSGVGHLQGTSIPIGGESTHSVITGHRGLPSSKLFVRLDELSVGDLFYVKIADSVLAYKVDDINIIEPEDVSLIEIEAGKDKVSLVTCTPYGINTHRLVVTGYRVPYVKSEKEIIKGKIPSMRELFFTFLPFIFAIIELILFIQERRKNQDEKIKETYTDSTNNDISI